jgi:hypothetical protein
MPTANLDEGYFHNSTECTAPYIEVSHKGGLNPHLRGRVFIKSNREFSVFDMPPETLRQLKEAGVNETELDPLTISSMFYTSALRDAASKHAEIRVSFSSGQPARYKGEAFLAVGFQCPLPEENLKHVFKILQESGFAAKQSKWKFKKHEVEEELE